MNAAIYARYSSENQRPESIEDQVSSCRKLAIDRGYVVLDSHIYFDEAASGARKDRAGLNSLLRASELGSFEVVLVDDLSRLARDNFLMFSVLAELRFNGINDISVADGLDSDDEESNLGTQIQGIFRLTDRLGQSYAAWRETGLDRYPRSSGANDRSSRREPKCA